MPTQDPFTIAETWLYTTLSADSTITGYVQGIYAQVADQGIDPHKPYIVIVNKSSKDLMVTNQDRVWTAMMYNVDLVVPGNDTVTPSPVAVKIDQLLHKGSGTTAGGIVGSCTRQGSGKMPSLEAGVLYMHVVQFYELVVLSS